MNRSLVFLYLFAGLSLIYMYAAATAWSALVYFTKPLVIPALAAYFWRASEPTDGPGNLPPRTRYYALAALLFSTIGDVLLMFEEAAEPQAAFFMAGLTSFLCAHLFYIGAFRELRVGGVVRVSLLWFAPILYLGVMWYVLLPHLPAGMLLPVILYSLVITVMLFSVLLLSPKYIGRAYYFLLLGALLFIISDSLLASAHFGVVRWPVVYERIFVLGTYFGAQYFLVRGLVVAGAP